MTHTLTAPFLSSLAEWKLEVSVLSFRHLEELFWGLPGSIRPLIAPVRTLFCASLPL